MEKTVLSWIIEITRTPLKSTHKPILTSRVILRSNAEMYPLLLQCLSAFTVGKKLARIHPYHWAAELRKQGQSPEVMSVKELGSLQEP